MLICAMCAICDMHVIIDIEKSEYLSSVYNCVEHSLCYGCLYMVVVCVLCRLLR